MKFWNSIGLLLLPSRVIPEDKGALPVSLFHYFHEVRIGELVRILDEERIEVTGWHLARDLCSFDE
jgi:hypothetical protein